MTSQKISGWSSKVITMGPKGFKIVSKNVEVLNVDPSIWRTMKLNNV